MTVSHPQSFPALRSVVFDTTNARALAEFYRAVLGYEYRPGEALYVYADLAGHPFCVFVASES